MPILILLSSNPEGKIVAAILFALVIAFFFTEEREKRAA